MLEYEKDGEIMVAKEFMKQARLYDTHINNKLEELQHFKDMVTKITTSLKPDAGIKSSGSQDKLGDTVAKIVDLQTEVNQAIDVYVDKKREINSLLEKIKDPDQLEVLYKRYIGIWDPIQRKQYYPSWEEISVSMHMTYRNVCYIHGKALQTVAELMKEDET